MFLRKVAFLHLVVGERVDFWNRLKFGKNNRLKPLLAGFWELNYGKGVVFGQHVHFLESLFGIPVSRCGHGGYVLESGFCGGIGTKRAFETVINNMPHNERT